MGRDYGRHDHRNGQQVAHLATPLGAKLRAAHITRAGPPCLECGEPIDTRSRYRNVTQGWVCARCQAKRGTTQR